MNKFFFFFLLTFFSCQKNKLKIINSSIESGILTIDPQKSYDMASNTIVNQLYETLYQYHYLKRPYALSPLLASEMPEVSDDGLIYTIKIKKNIIYHNWEKFSDKERFVTSYDFINGIKRLAFKKTDSKGWWLLQNKIIGLDKFRKETARNLELFLKNSVKGLVPLSDHSFQIKLIKPYPELIHILAMSFTSPIPLEVIKKFSDQFESQEFGTGPYVLKNYDPKSEINLRKFDRYSSSLYPSTGDRAAHENKMFKDARKKLPLNDGIDFKIIHDDSKAWSAFLKKELDFLDLSPEITDSVINLNGKVKKKFRKKNISIDVSPSLVFWWLGFNMLDPVVGSNKNLRKAIAHAINIKSYVNNFYSHLGNQANSLYPPGVQGHSTLKKWPYKHDIKKALNFMELAGYPKGKGLPILEFHTRREGERHILMAKFIQKELSKIGITMNIVINDFSSFLSKAKKGKMQFWSSGWLMDYPAPQNVLQLLYSKNGRGGPNKTSFSNPVYDKLYEQFQKSRDQIEKENLLTELEKIALDEVPWILTNYSINYVTKQNNLKNLRYSDLIFNMYKYLDKK